LLAGQIRAQDLLATDPGAARSALKIQLATHNIRLTTSQITAAMAQARYTNNPLAPTITVQAHNAANADLLKAAAPTDVIYDLAPLNKLLRSAGQLPVSS
jgi:hypothetical protein